MKDNSLWSVYQVTEYDGMRAEVLVAWGLSFEECVRHVRLQWGDRTGFVLREMVPQS